MPSPSPSPSPSHGQEHQGGEQQHNKEQLLLVPRSDIRPNDVLCGTKTKGHKGNITLRAFCSDLADEYAATSDRAIKLDVVQRVVDYVESELGVSGGDGLGGGEGRGGGDHQRSQLPGRFLVVAPEDDRCEGSTGSPRANGAGGGRMPDYKSIPLWTVADDSVKLEKVRQTFRDECRPRAQERSNYLTKAVARTESGPHDVLMGRGGGTNHFPGNVAFRELVKKYKLRYLSVPKVEKPKVAVDVVAIWRKLDPPGRFLELCTDNQTGRDVGDKRARLKASQCLRERTPEVMQFCKVPRCRMKDYVKEVERARRENVAEILVPLAQQGKSQLGCFWIRHNIEEYFSVQMRYKSLVDKRTCRLIPIYLLLSGKPPRRCIQRGLNRNVDYLAAVVKYEIDNADEAPWSTYWSLSETHKEPPVASTQCAWVCGVHTGRIELASLSPEEKEMLQKIRHRAKLVDPSVTLPA